VGKLSSPLRDRFGLIHRMDFYSDAELTRIIANAADKLMVRITTDAAGLLAKRSRKTARIALKLLKRVRDYAQVHGNGQIETAMVAEALALMEVDEKGWMHRIGEFCRRLSRSMRGGRWGYRRWQPARRKMLLR
jgi:holliday junction DNA helicase RuvB